jgi:hypothetical protein
LSVESLPYTLLLLLGQYTAGVAALVYYAHLRGTFEPGFIRVCTWMIVAGAVMLALTALFIHPVRQVDGYALDSDLMEPIRGVTLALMLFSFVYLYFVRSPEEQFLTYATGASMVGLSAITLVLLAALVRDPTWSIAGPLLTMFAGAGTIGASMVAMIWGHWYLVNPRLPEGPLNELTLITLGAVLFAFLVTAINAIIPVGTPFESNAMLAVSLPQNPAFWLRIGLGLLFPTALAYMAYRSSAERAMMSATGLLYIAVGAILAGEAVGRGPLFVTGAAV